MSVYEERVRAGTPLRIAGAGTWMDAGHFADAPTLSLGGDAGIVEYVPGDLTLTARAGTRIADLVAAVKANGQWLPLDPWGGDHGTLGATISTATAGPHAYAMGLPRDVVLGMEFVTGNGETVRAGGRVVKNVAGFDLTRLLVGSWGTLGVITEVTVRLRARPDQTRTFALDVAESRERLSELATRIRALPFSLLASELINPALALHLGAGEGATLLVRLGGNAKALAGQLDLVRTLGEPREFEERVWPALRSADPAGAATWRWSQLPTHFGTTWNAARRATSALTGTFLHGNPARGIVRIVTTPTPNVPDATRFDGTCVIERMPANVSYSTRLGIATDDVSRAIKARFDPRGILNPPAVAS